MKSPKTNIKKVLFLLLFGLMFLPMSQEVFNLFKLKPLGGDIEITNDKKFKIKNWFTGTFSEDKEKYLNDNFGCRNFFVRLNNQIDYSLFKKVNAKGIIIGKNDYPYEKGYIKAYFGEDFIGEDKIREKMKIMLFLQDTLESLGKDLIIVFAPNKASFFPEYLPEEYDNKKPRQTNLKAFTKAANTQKLQHIDFSSYLIQNKGKMPYPLYPQYGLHWSQYGACLAADSLYSYIEHVQGINMPDLYWDSVELAEPRFEDCDIHKGLNIFSKIETYKMAYPYVRFENDSGKTKPSVLTIGDSFYWQIFNLKNSNCFKINHFWYYDYEVYPESRDRELLTSELNLAEQIKLHDVIIVIATEPNLIHLGWGFLERLYSYYTGEYSPESYKIQRKVEIKKIERQIRNNEEWMEEITEKANKREISIDSMITLDAIWTIDSQ